MKFNKTAVFLFASSAFSLTPEEIKTKVGDGCANSVSFASSFLTDAGSPCTSCGFCSGSALNHLFDPNKSSTCVECGTKENSCNKFKVITAFDKAWKMTFFSILSSDASYSDDPKRIIVEGSNNHDGDGSATTWTTLYDSDQESGVDFSSRSAEELIIFDNDQEFKYYSISFDKKVDSSKIQIGNYGLIQAYTKECTSKLHEELTGTMVPPYVTSAPTSAPTKSPTIAPTASPTASSLLPNFGEFQLTRNKKLHTIQNPPMNSILSFELYPMGIVSGFSSILRMTQDNRSDSGPTDRWFAFWFTPSSYVLHFAAYPGGLIWEVPGEVYANTWNPIKVEQIGDKINLYVNNVKRGELANKNRPLPPYLQVYAGGSFYPAANAKMKNLVFSPID